MMKNQFVKQMTKVLQTYFSEPIMKGLAYFMVSLIEDNWNKISTFTTTKAIGQYLLNKIFKGTGDLIFGQEVQKPQRKYWTNKLPIRFRK